MQTQVNNVQLTQILQFVLGGMGAGPLKLHRAGTEHTRRAAVQVSTRPKIKVKKRSRRLYKGKEEKVEAKKAVFIPFYKEKSQAARAEWRSILQNLAWAKQVSHHQLRIHYNYLQLAIMKSNSVTACIIACRCLPFFVEKGEKSHVENVAL